MYTPAKLLPQMAEAIPGVTAYAATLGLPAGMAAAMTTQETDLQTLQNQYLNKVEELKTAEVAKRVAMKAGQTFIALARELARPTLGSRFSQNWAAFGFAGSLKVPRSVDGLVSLLGTMAVHLTSHPQFGSEDLNIDAAQAEVLRDNLTAAVAVVNVKKSEVRQKFEERAVKTGAARLSLRTVLSACRLKFDPFDGRWLEFGFNRPGVKSVPPVPTGLTATLAGANALMVKWSAAARAESYRIWLKVVGVHPELMSYALTPHLEFLLSSLPANSQVEIALSAMNDGGESVKSPVLTMVTP